MNAVTPPPVREVRAIDLADGAACRAFDALAARLPGATPFHRTAWGRAIAAAFGHRPHYLMVDGDGVLPLIALRSRLFGNAMISSAFAVRGGPLFGDRATLHALDAAAWTLTRAEGIGVLEYRCGEPLHDWPAKAATYANFARPLSASSDDNLKSIPRKQRAEVRRAQTLGLDVRVAADARALADHFRVYAASVRNLGTPVFSPRLFAAILHEYGDDADILTVYKDGAPVASVLSLYDADCVYPYYGGGTAAARALRANEHMYWMLMEHAVARGKRGFDFGRSKVGTGAYDYKKNWGFEPTPLVYEYRLADGAAMPDVNPNNPRYRLMTEVWRRLPLWFANRAGPLIARSLG
jgi:FemAB-related protein (PEP-CTERM system-associated)